MQQTTTVAEKKEKRFAIFETFFSENFTNLAEKELQQLCQKLKKILEEK